MRHALTFAAMTSLALLAGCAYPNPGGSRAEPSPFSPG